MAEKTEWTKLLAKVVTVFRNNSGLSIVRSTRYTTYPVI
jgi:hypothetical protein